MSPDWRRLTAVPLNLVLALTLLATALIAGATSASAASSPNAVATSTVVAESSDLPGGCKTTFIASANMHMEPCISQLANRSVLPDVHVKFRTPRSKVYSAKLGFVGCRVETSAPTKCIKDSVRTKRTVNITRIYNAGGQWGYDRKWYPTGSWKADPFDPAKGQLYVTRMCLSTRATSSSIVKKVCRVSPVLQAS